MTLSGESADGHIIRVARCRPSGPRRVLLGGVAGRILPPPLFRSEGKVIIDLSLPTIADPLGRKVDPNSDSFVDEQVALLRSDRVAALAVESRA